MERVVRSGNVLMDNQQVLFWGFVGGRNYQNQNNHAFDTKRSPASTTKPLLRYCYWPGLDGKWNDSLLTIQQTLLMAIRLCMLIVREQEWWPWRSSELFMEYPCLLDLSHASWKRVLMSRVIWKRWTEIPEYGIGACQWVVVLSHSRPY